MRILWFNWKDIRYFEVGGVEVYIYEIVKRLVEKGYEVIFFILYFNGVEKEDEIDGVKIVRSGKIVGFFDMVYFYVKRFYRDNKNDFDVVIDEINIWLFLILKYVDKLIIVLIY